MVDWGGMFVNSTPLLELFLRGTLVFLALLVLMRIVGQRESGGLGLSDLLVAVLVGAALGDGMTGGGTSLLDGLVPAATVLFWSVTIDALSYRWAALRRLLKGHARNLITDGRVDRAAMRRELISMEELSAELHAHELDDISQVRRAYLEPNGEIGIIPIEGATDSGAEERERPAPA